MKTLYLIGGTMGVGKSTVAQALARRLPDNVLLDGDWCWMMRPFRVTEETKRMVMDNICDLLCRFLRCTVYQNVIFCWVLHEQAILDELCARLPLDGCRVVPVSLVCTPEELTRRLMLRGDADTVARSTARLPLYDTLRTFRLDVTGLTPEQTAQALEKIGTEPVHCTVLQTPVGRLCIEDNGDAVTAVHALSVSAAAADPMSNGNLSASAEIDGASPVGRVAAGQLTEYFEGKRKSFTVPFQEGGTPFQRRIWAALRAIPYGETRSYAQLAAAAGSPGAARAAGGAAHRNPLLILTPCHRAIGADGSLTGFAAGLPVKEALLRLEQCVGGVLPPREPKAREAYYV